MDNSILIKKIPFYSSWIALAVFVCVLVFQPGKATFYAIRPSDVWLLFCLFLQIINGDNVTIPFRNRFLIRNYGLFMGILVIIATLIQASYANISLDISFIFNFYRFLRFLLIFKFVENIILNLNSGDAQKFWRVYTLMGTIIMILSFLEFNDIMPYKLIIIDLYYYNPNLIAEAYLTKVENSAGVMGNYNATAILLVSTLTYPLLRIVNKGGYLIKKILYIFYVFTVVYVLVVMTGSRTAIFISLLMPIIIIIAAAGRLKNLFFVVILTLFVTAIGVYFYQRFKSEIIVQDRITEALRGENFNASAEGIGKWMNRYEMWQDRFRTFNREGNQLAILLGLGYTKANEDYADNGLISAFIYNGITGLLLKLLLFYFFVTYGFLRAIRNYHQKKIDLSYLAVALSTFALLLWELTADMTEHYKLGQLFYLFLSIIMIINGKLFSTNS